MSPHRALTVLGAILVALPGLSCGLSEATEGLEPPPVREFERIAERLFAGKCPSFGRAPKRELRESLAKPGLGPEARLQNLTDLGFEYVKTGQIEVALETLEQGMRLAERLPEGQKRRTAIHALHRNFGQAYLRQAENLNCVLRHTAECCILATPEGAVHQERQPAELARQHYLAMLEDKPDSLSARWVVNLLALLLGDYPEGVPEAHRIPASAFGVAEEGTEPRFRDVAITAGLDTFNLAGGVAVEDFDGDGWLDVLTSTCDPLGPLSYFRSRGDGTFEDRSKSSRSAEQLGGLNLISGDYDNDGDQDAVVLRGAWMLDFGCIRKSLLRNDDGRTWVDVTRAAGMATPEYPTQAAAFGDYDGDGWLDLYVGNEANLDYGGQGDYPSQLFRNDRLGGFADVASVAGVENRRYAKGVCAGDYDEDGDLDIYVSNIGPNRLYRNDGTAGFEDVAREAHVTEPLGRSFACWFFDYDEDGLLDLWVSGYAASIGDLAAEALGVDHEGVRSCLYRNQGDGTFENVARRSGLNQPWLPMGANFGDMNGDGWLDIYLGTGDPSLESLMPNVALENRAGGKGPKGAKAGRVFADVTAETGLGHLQKGHGIGFADFDHDGDQDIFHQLGGFFPVDKYQNALFENRGPAGHRWLALELVGTRSNRDAVGARVKVVLESPTGLRAVHRAQGCVSSFGGSPHRMEIGLGDATRIWGVEIQWPLTEEPQVLADVPLDSWLRVTEGEEGFERLERGTYRFPSERP